MMQIQCTVGRHVLRVRWPQRPCLVRSLKGHGVGPVIPTAFVLGVGLGEAFAGWRDFVRTPPEVPLTTHFRSVACLRVRD